MEKQTTQIPTIVGQSQRKKAVSLILISAIVMLAFMMLGGCIAMKSGSLAMSQPFSLIVDPRADTPATPVLPAEVVTSTQSTVVAAVPAASAPITIENFSFDPGVYTVTVGSSVTWTNQDDMPHTVKSVDHLFSSPALDTGESFTFQFDQPGVYRYYCAIHPMMTAMIVVR